MKEKLVYKSTLPPQSFRLPHLSTWPHSSLASTLNHVFLLLNLVYYMGWPCSFHVIQVQSLWQGFSEGVLSEGKRGSRTGMGDCRTMMRSPIDSRLIWILWGAMMHRWQHRVRLLCICKLKGEWEGIASLIKVFLFVWGKSIANNIYSSWETSSPAW